MVQTAAETLNEIEAAKDRLAGSLDTLEGRLPPTDELGRQAAVGGGAVAGAGVGLVLLVGWLRRRSEARAEERAKRQDARIRAEELAGALERLRPFDHLAADGRGAASPGAEPAPPADPAPSPAPGGDDESSGSKLGWLALLGALIGLVVALSGRGDGVDELWD